MTEPSTFPVAGSSGELLGREHEREQLHGLIRRATAGRGGLALLAGEPGIGKSSLAGDAAATAAAAGMATVWATCWQGPGTPAYWPWVQVLRHVRRTLPIEQVRAAFADVAADLGPLAQEVTPGAAPGDEADRFRVFDAVTQGLLALGHRTPLFVVVDDLHWADAPSIELLDFAAQQSAATPIVFVGTYRDVELDDDHPVRALVGRSAAHVVHLQLSGLTPDAIGSMLRAVGTGEPAADLVERVMVDSGGNPFFVRELGRLLAGGASPDAADIPHNVRQVVRDRVQRMPGATVEALALASVVGVTFRLTDLAALAGVTVPGALELMEPAVSARLVRAGEHSHRFVHALVPEVLYEDLPGPRRAELHARHAAHLEAAATERLDTHIDELAHHWARAVPAADPERAVAACTRAADHAIELLAYEQAIDHYARAVRFQEQAGTGPLERAALLHSLARAQNLAAAPLLAVSTRQEAARLARRAGDASLLAEVGLETGEPFVMHSTDLERIAILEDALAGLDPVDSPQRARAMAGLATALLFTADERRKEQLFRDAVAMARRLGDPPTLARVLAEQVGGSRADDAERRLAVATEVVALAEQLGDRRLGLHGRVLRVGVLVELADGPALRVELDAFERLAEASRLRVFSRIVPLQHAMLSVLAGDWAEAEDLLGDAAESYRRSRQATGTTAVVIAERCLRFAQGRGGEVAPALERAAEALPDAMAVRAAAALAVTATQPHEATTRLARIGVSGMHAAPRDFTWLAGVAFCGQAAVAVGDRDIAAAAHELLAPHASTFVTFSRTATAILGPAGFTLGLTAEALGRVDDAVAAYEAALTACERIAAPVFAADVRHALARCLALRGRPGDAERALLEAASAAGAADARGVELPLNGVAPASAVPPGNVARPRFPGADGGTATREGDVWALTFQAETVRIRHSIGIGHLVRLLAAPGVELHVLDLTSRSPGAAATSARMPLLDDAAKAAYRARVAELRRDLDEATEWNDSARADRLQLELDALLAELSRAVGLGGRDRAAPDEAERARFAVTKAIRTAIRRIGEHHGPLGEHLERTVRTGTQCSYLGEVRWQISA